MLRNKELAFWGCEKRRRLLEGQPPPPYAPSRLSDFPQAEYVKTLYRLPCVGDLAMVQTASAVGRIHIKKLGGWMLSSPQG